MQPIVITSIARAPQGNLLGALKNFTSPQLGSAVIEAVVKRSNLQPDDIQEVLMGCVLPAGLGQAPARQAALGAGIPASIPCSTINKVCGSGMKAVMVAHDSLIAGSQTIMVAGGMESMTNAPYLLKKARAGYRLGHSELYDHMMLDGLEDAYETGRPMGYFAELCAKQFNFSRAQQDDYAISSLERALKAIHDKSFATEIVPLVVKEKSADIIIDTDEHPLSVKIDRVKTLPPIFMKDGTVTAANSSSIADGAAALVLMTLQEAEKRGIKPLAKIIAHASSAKDSSEFTTAPIDATKKLMEKINWSVNDVDLFEINEAFAVVTLAAMKALNIPREKLNIHRGGR